LGLFPSGLAFNVSFLAQPVSPAATVNYLLLNGTLPVGMDSDPVKFSNLGVLSGTPQNVAVETIHTFTIRAVDNMGGIKDRTFSIKIFGSEWVHIETQPGEILNIIDSQYVDYTINVANPVIGTDYRVTLSSGILPPGLFMDTTGRITGYPEPPILLNGSPTTKTYEFSVQLTSHLGIDNKIYSITVRNFSLNHPPNTRVPAIINNTPVVQPLDPEDPYYGYYLPEDNIIPTVRSGEYFSFKVIGYDFDRNRITYQYSKLPTGLTGDPNTGWITGTPILPPDSIAKFDIAVTVSKAMNTSIVSSPEVFQMTITNGITEDIVWNTVANLGTVNNGSISELFVKATSAQTIEYRLLDGALPPNLELLSNGQIVGRIPNQPDVNGLLKEGTSSTYTFTIRAYNPIYPVVSNDRTFTLTIYQKYKVPTENLYFKATPNVKGRTIIQSLLTDDTLIPTEYLYRAEDPYFGKATDVRYVHIYGMEPYNLSTYIEAVGTSHYNRKVVLGEIKTAVARDSNGNILYEVVYADIVDDLINANGVSIPQEIIWPRRIPLDLGPYFVTNNQLFVSSGTIYDSFTGGFVRNLNPASTTNMRTELTDRLVQNQSQDILPLWMTSQQINGNTLGYVQAWVIAYTLPGYAETIKDNINNNWEYTLNLIDFSIDRFNVDRSGTFDYNTNLYSGAWTNLPSATPTPDPMDQYDIPVLFPRKTILPKTVDY
jgi:hypothetical protein